MLQKAQVEEISLPTVFVRGNGSNNQGENGNGERSVSTGSIT